MVSLWVEARKWKRGEKEKGSQRQTDREGEGEREREREIPLIQQNQLCDDS